MGIKPLPSQQEALRQVAEQEGEFFHLWSDDGTGLERPIDNELFSERARRALGRSAVQTETDRRDLSELGTQTNIS